MSIKTGNASILKITLMKSNNDDLENNLRKQVMIDNIRKRFVKQHPALKTVFDTYENATYRANITQQIVNQ